MKTIAGFAAGIVLASSVAVAGGNPDENDFGVGTRDPIVRDQYQVQQEVEAEVFSKPQINRKPLRTGIAAGEELAAELSDPLVVPEKESECWAPFSWLASQLGGECYRDSNFHNPSAVSFHTVETVSFRDEIETKDKKVRTHSKRAARRLAGILNRYSEKIAGYYGYDDLTAIAKGKKVKVTLSKTVQVPYKTLTKIRSDARGADNGGTADRSSGMRGRAVDTGDGGNDRF